MIRKPSPKAADELMNAIADGEVDDMDGDELMGQTDCEEGCFVEPDGYCSHGYNSAGITLGVI